MSLRKRRRFFLLLLTLFFLLIVVMVVSISVGSSEVGFWQTLRVLGHSTGLSDSPSTRVAEMIVLHIRLPRVMLAALVGAALAVAGGIYQALIRNPLGDPYILGVSSGAVLGSVIGLISGMGGNWLGTQLSAFIGAVVAIIIVYNVAKTGGRINTMKLVLAGVIVSAFFSGITMFLFSIATGSEVTNILFWMMGDLSTQSLSTVWRIAPLVLGIMGLLYLLSGELNLVMVSEENALQLGVNVERVKKGAFLLASLLTGAVVSVSGAIGFIGLIVPNMIRLLWGTDLRYHLPLTALSGAGFLVLSDTLARLVMTPTELPVGVITAAFGAPFFIYLLKQKVG